MTIATLRYGDRSTEYHVATADRLTAKILIHVHPNGIVEVEAPPNRAAAVVQAAVQKRARWIFDNLDSAKDARAYALPREYIGGETHFYLGRRYRLLVREERTAPSSVKLVRGCIEIVAPVVDQAAIKRRLRHWYRVRAQDYFRRRLDHIAASIDWLSVSPPMKLVPMEHQWGSCSPTGSIHLNPALIRAPRHCIDYVLLHELCHLREHNHSKKFYALLSKHDSHWVDTKAELDRLAELLLVE
ncbi:MAG: SprT family zinc-dependent metalloprotease [Sphingobium sp.]